MFGFPNCHTFVMRIQTVQTKHRSSDDHIIDLRRKLNYVDEVSSLSLTSLTWTGLSRIPSIILASRCQIDPRFRCAGNL